MVYKRYIRKDGKVYGPYVYHSRKKGGKVISEYRGKAVEKKKTITSILIVLGFIFIFSLMFVLNYNFNFVETKTLTETISNFQIPSTSFLNVLTGFVISETPENESAEEIINETISEELISNETITEVLNESKEENETIINGTVPELVNQTINETNISGDNNISIDIDEALTNVTENITNTTTGVNINIKTIQYQAVLNQPVKWKKQVSLDIPVKTKIILPEEATEITVNKIEEEQEAKFSITGGVISEGGWKDSFLLRFIRKIIGAITGSAIEEIGQEIEVEIDDTATEYEIEYETPAPYAIEEDIEKGKRIKIIGPETIHYENVLSFTNLDESSKNSIKLYRTTAGIREQVQITNYQDLNNNGLIDYIEWITPVLSEQTFEIIVITKAEHLDSNREFISDIYEYVNETDGVIYTIPENQYARAYFERNLSSVNVIDIYVTNTQTATIEVYEKDSNIIIGDVEIESEGVYYIELSHSGSQSIFDLKSIGNDIIYDYIHDAAPGPPAFDVVPKDYPDPVIEGGNVIFNATAIDPKGDDWYLAICKTNAVSVGPPPTCPGEAYCVSGATASGQLASCTWVSDVSGDWWGFPCDSVTAQACGTVDNTNDPVTVNPAGRQDDFPTVALNSPIDYDNTTLPSVTFNCTGSDDINLTNVSLYGNWGGWHLNQTNSTPVNNTPVIFSETISDGSYIWNCRAGDNSSQYNFSTSNRTFTIDSTAPSISITSVNDTSVSPSAKICINATVTDSGVGIDEVWAYIIYPNATQVNVTMTDTGSGCGGIADNWYGVDFNVGSTQGTLTINTTYANDTLGNLGDESPWPNLQVTVSDAPPQYYALSVNDSTPNPTDTVRHNVYWNDDTELSYATLEINSTGAGCNVKSNISATSLSPQANEWANLSWAVPQACEGKTIGWKQYANDSLGQWNSSMPLQTYTVNDINPTASFGTDPVDYYNDSDGSIIFQLKVSDNLGVDGLKLYGNWTGIWHANQTNSTPFNNTIWSVTVNNIPEGKKHRWAVWGNDTVGNSDWTDTTNRSFTVDVTGPGLSNEGANETNISQNEWFCLNITATDVTSNVDTVYAEVYNTTDWLNYSMSEDGTSCDGTGSDGIYGKEIQGTTQGIWNYSKVWANDTFGNLKMYDFTDLTINVTAPADSYYPQFSGFQEDPLNDSDYSFGQDYQFNSTVTYTNGTVFLNFDGTNYTASNDTISNFYVDIASLSADTYNYYWWGYGNGSQKNYNSSSSRAYVVKKITDSCSVVFNESSPITYPNKFKVWTNCTSTFTLYRNQSIISNNSVQNLSAEAYNFTVIRNDSVNYSNVYDEQIFAISKANPAASLTNTDLWTVTYPEEVTIGRSESNEGDGGVVYKVYRDGADKGDGETVTLGYGNYNYVLNTTGGENYTANSSIDAETLIVQQNTGSCSVLFNESSGITYGTIFKVWTNCTSVAVLYRNQSIVANNSPQNLAAETYNFTVIRNDSINYSNVYDEQNFVVSQAIGEIATYIDNVRNNESVLFHSKRWLNATLITGVGNIKLYYNNILIEQGPSPLSNLTNFTSEGEFNVTGMYAGNENYTSDVETWWVTVSSDSAPTLTLNSPVDHYNSSSTNIQFNCTADDDINLINVSLYGNWSGWHLNETNLSPVNNAPVIFDKTISEGIYVWNCKACDSISQCNFASANYTFTVDKTYPAFLSYARDPDPPNEDENIQVNVTITETNLDKVILEWDETTNYTVTTSNGNEYYYTVLSGNYTAHDSVTYHWYANDSAGNMNKSEQQFFTVANQIPILTVDEPDGINDNTKTDFTVTWIASDNDAEDTLTISCYGDADGSGHDKAYTCFTETEDDDSENCVVSSWDDGTYYIWCNATDTYTGTPDYSSGELTIDKTGPTIGSETKDKTPNEDQDVQLNATITDSGVGLDTVWVNVSINNTAETKFIVISHSGDEYYFNLSKTNYTAHDIVNWTYHANDTLDNLGSGTMQSFIVANQIPTLLPVPLLNNTSPKTNDLIKCNAGTFQDDDEEDDSPQNTGWKWYKNNAEISGEISQTLDLSTAGNGNKGDLINCSERVYDNYNWSDWYNSSNTASIDNTAPTIDNPQPPVNKDADGTPYNYDYDATDPDVTDGVDTLTWYDNTTLFNINSATGVISDTPTEAQVGSYSIRINVSDGTVNDTDDFTYTINDVTNPLIDFGTGTENDNTFFSRDWIYVNVTFSDTNNHTLTFELYNDTGRWNITHYQSLTRSPRTINWTSLNEETYYYNVTVNDTSGNSNTSETRTLTLDTTYPLISLVNPQNTSYNSVKTTLNYTFSDVNTDTCWYSTDNGITNTTINCGDNVTGLDSGQDSSTWTIWVNDSVGNENSSSVTFFVDSILPLIDFVSPTEDSGETVQQNYIEVNVTASDTNLDTITIRLYNSTSDLIKTNTSVSSPFNITYSSLSGGTYYYNATANDTLGNENSTETRNITLDISPPSLAIINPENETYLTNISLLLNYSVSGEDYIWYNVNGTNITITSAIYFNTTEGGHTLYLYANNTFGEVSDNVTFTVNSSKFKIYYNKWRGSNKGTSTHFNQSSYEDIQNLSNVVLEHTQHGKIKFNEAINVTDDEDPTDNQVNISAYTNISSNRIELNSIALPNFNKAATLYLYNLTLDAPVRILKDGSVCLSAICTQQSYTGGTLIFNVTQFTVYSAEEIPSNGVAPPPSGGGGGAERVTDFSLSRSLIDVNIKQDDVIREIIIVKNIGNNDMQFNLSIYEIERFVILSEEYFTLSPGESKEINVDFFAAEDEPAGVYAGRIIIIGDSLSKSINVVFEVKERAALFDIRSGISDITLAKNQKLKATINMINIGDLEKSVDVILEYFIKDFEGNEIKIEEETLAVYDTLEIEREFSLPETLEYGDYLFYIKLTYLDSTATSANRFNIIEELPFITYIKQNSQTLIIILAIIILFLIYNLRRKYKKVQVRERYSRKRLLFDKIEGIYLKITYKLGNMISKYRKIPAPKKRRLRFSTKRINYIIKGIFRKRKVKKKKVKKIEEKPAEEIIEEITEEEKKPEEKPAEEKKPAEQIVKEIKEELPSEEERKEPEPSEDEKKVLEEFYRKVEKQEVNKKEPQKTDKYKQEPKDIIEDIVEKEKSEEEKKE